MKKALVCILAMFTGMGIFAQQLTLDEVIKRSAETVEGTLPQGAKVALLNFASTSETFSDHVIEELTGLLVNGKKITIVDRRNLALITQEMNLQLSGDVSDESAQAIGKMLGAQSIISGTLTNMGTFYRFRIRVINVETAAIQTQVSLDLKNDSQVAFLLSGNQASSPQVESSGTTSRVITPSIEGTNVPGNSLTEKLAWLQKSADSHNTYILEAKANENIAPYIFEFKGAINITVVIRGDSVNRTIRLRTNGVMFTVKTDVTLILDNNITLQGHNGNNDNVVNVEGGTLKMNIGSTITGNSTYGGVCIKSGIFEMTGGMISGNGKYTSFWGGGVDVYSGTFTMSGGTISDNKATKGAGVSVRNGAKFYMRGGTITSNTALENGGGVFVVDGGTFSKSGGTITGYVTDQNNGNVIRDEAGNMLARRGSAVYVNDNLRKESTAGPGMSLSNKDSGRWD